MRAISSSIAATTCVASFLYRPCTVSSVGPSQSKALLDGQPRPPSTVETSSRPRTRPRYSRDASPPVSRCASTASGTWSGLPRGGMRQPIASAETFASLSVCTSELRGAEPSGSSTSGRRGAGRGGSLPKYFSTRASSSPAFTSPTIASTALLGP